MSEKRRVAINETVKVHEILSIYDYTASEISASWFDSNEMDKITDRCFRILQKIEGRKSKNGQKYCIRGLEGHTTIGSITKSNNRSAAYIAMLDEQERHWDDEPDIRVQAMSDAYQRISSSCQMWAQVVGNRDEQAVEAYLHDDHNNEDEDADATAVERVVTATAYSPAPTVSTPCSRIRKTAPKHLPKISPRSVTIF